MAVLGVTIMVIVVTILVALCVVGGVVLSTWLHGDRRGRR